MAPRRFPLTEEEGGGGGRCFLSVPRTCFGLRSCCGPVNGETTGSAPGFIRCRRGRVGMGVREGRACFDFLQYSVHGPSTEEGEMSSGRPSPNGGVARRLTHTAQKLAGHAAPPALRRKTLDFGLSVTFCHRGSGRSLQLLHSEETRFIFKSFYCLKHHDTSHLKALVPGSERVHADSEKWGFWTDPESSRSEADTHWSAEASGSTCRPEHLHRSTRVMSH